MTPTPPPARSWYRDGLRFECTSCGRCCTGTTGYVWMEGADIHALAEHLSLTLDEIGHRYLRRVGTRYALLEAPATGDCVFLDGTRCSVYAVRPRQCRSYPFWDALLESAQTWAEAARECEGIRPEAALVSARRIDALRRG